MTTVDPAHRAQRYRAMLALPASIEDWEFTSVLISRPIGFLLLHAFERFSFLTPNRITLLSFLSFLGAAFFIAHAPHAVEVIAALLFVRLVFDDFDGMLARARNASSYFGSYLDKVTDIIGFFVFFMVLGFHVSQAQDDPRLLILAAAGITSLVTTGYIKWVVRAMEPAPPAPPSATSSTAPLSAHSTLPIPRWRVFLILLIRLVAVNECDIFLFSIVLLLLRQYHVLLWVLSLSQLVLCIGMIFKRGYRAWVLDRR